MSVERAKNHSIFRWKFKLISLFYYFDRQLSGYKTFEPVLFLTARRIPNISIYKLKIFIQCFSQIISGTSFNKNQRFQYSQNKTLMLSWCKLCQLNSPLNTTHRILPTWNSTKLIQGMVCSHCVVTIAFAPVILDFYRIGRINCFCCKRHRTGLVNYQTHKIHILWTL